MNRVRTRGKRWSPRHILVKWGSRGLIIGLLLMWRSISGQSINNSSSSDEDIRSNDLRQAFFRFRNRSLNCTVPGIEQFPRPLMPPEIRAQGGVILHILAAIYVLVALSLVCDEYFVPSLDLIIQSLDMEPDVAGATFMAAGSSAPELASSVIGVFVTENDIGIGTVVGSAVFNVALVIGVSGIVAGSRGVKLQKWPLSRDSFFYVASILVLYFAMNDGLISWVESMAFLTLYVIYCIFLAFNKPLESLLTSIPSRKRSRAAPVESNEEDGGLEFASDIRKPSIYQEDHPIKRQTENHGTFTNDVITVVDHDPMSASGRSLWILKKIALALVAPIRLVNMVTIPNCRMIGARSWFPLTFIMSSIWIGVHSYLLVWMVTIIGYTLHIPDTVMGLTFLAASVSLPDLITSAIVIKEGQGDMAVSNAIASNIFDILMCLGLPWFIRTSIGLQDASGNSLPVVPVKSNGLQVSTISLLITVIILFGLVQANRWTLDRKLGIILSVWYFGFIVIASLYEMNIFGYVEAPICPSNY